MYHLIEQHLVLVRFVFVFVVVLELVLEELQLFVLVQELV